MPCVLINVVLVEMYRVVFINYEKCVVMKNVMLCFENEECIVRGMCCVCWLCCRLLIEM